MKLLLLVLLALVGVTLSQTGNVTVDSQLAYLQAEIDAIKTATTNADNAVAKEVVDIDMLWLLFGGFFVLFMQAGFALLEAGSVSSSNLGETIFKNLLITTIGAICFWLIGFGVAFGYSDDQHQNGFIGTGSIVLISDGYFPGNGYSFGHWVFQWSYAALTATIMLGAMAERTEFHAYMFLTVWITMWVYPIIAHWVWSKNGWLTGLAECVGCLTNPKYEIFHLGKNGMLDVAGSGVVHIVAGFGALVGNYMVGNRPGRFSHFSPYYKAEEFTGKKLYHILAVMILWVCWFAYNCAAAMGITRSMNSDQVGRAALTTALCSATCALCALPVSKWLYDKYDMTLFLNSILAGLVSISASCCLIEPYAALPIGVVGFAVYFTVHHMMLRVEMDDPMDTFAIHGACGMWGCIAVGLFLTKGNLEWTYHKQTGKYGWLYGGGLEQLGVQFIGVLCIAGWSVVMNYFLMYILRRRWCWIRTGLRLNPEVKKRKKQPAAELTNVTGGVAGNDPQPIQMDPLPPYDYAHNAYGVTEPHLTNMTNTPMGANQGYGVQPEPAQPDPYYAQAYQQPAAGGGYSAAPFDQYGNYRPAYP